MSQGQEKVGRLGQVRNQLRRKMRRDDLDEKFSAKRKQLLESDETQPTPEEIVAIQARIKRDIGKIKVGGEDYYEALEELWKDCLSQKAMTLYTPDDIKELSLLFVHFKRQRKGQSDYLSQLMMLSWIVSNWCYQFSNVPQEMGQMILAELQLLEENSSKKQLNQLIIYHLTNTCFIEYVRQILLQNNVASLVLSCELFPKKEADISTFLSNFLSNLPYRYRIAQMCADSIISFLTSTLYICVEEPYFLQDCVLIISKLLIINEGFFHGQVVRSLTPHIQLFIERLDLDDKFQEPAEVYELLIRVYKHREYSQADSSLFSDKTFASIWKILLEGINTKTTTFVEKFEKEQNIIYSLLYQICQIKSPVTDVILDQLYNRCLNKEAGDYEEKAIKVLAKCFFKQDEETFPFWATQLIEMSPNEELCVELLKVLGKCLAKCVNPMCMIDRIDKLEELLDRLKSSENEEIVQLSRKLIEVCEGKTNIMQEEVDVQTRTFATACEMLATPLRVPTSQSQKMQNNE